MRVLHETIQYLAERSKDDRAAESAGRRPVPRDADPGPRDTVSPPRVASYVWNEYLMLKPGGNRLYFIPDANHYLQADRPDAFVTVLLHGSGRLAARDPAPSNPNQELPAGRYLSRTAGRRGRPAPRRRPRQHELKTPGAQATT